MPDWLNIIILGIVEGITEFLPISSTGHLLIVENDKLLSYHPGDVFNVVIQSAAVIAVIPLFRKRFDQFIHRWRDPATQSYLAKLIAAFVITCIGGFIMQKKGWKLPEDIKPVAWALLIGGILFVAIEVFLRNKKLRDEVTWDVAIAVGLGQLVAAYFPGASRSGTTIMLSLLLGLSRPAATEFSFLVSIPTMLAAGASELHKAVHHSGTQILKDQNWSMLVLGMVISAVVSFIAVRWLLHYVQSHTFIGFGWYRIAIGIAVLAFFWHEPAHGVVQKPVTAFYNPRVSQPAMAPLAQLSDGTR